MANSKLRMSTLCTLTENTSALARPLLGGGGSSGVLTSAGGVPGAAVGGRRCPALGSGCLIAQAPKPTARSSTRGLHRAIENMLVVWVKRIMTAPAPGKPLYAREPGIAAEICRF